MSLSNSMMTKLSSLSDRFEEVGRLLSDPEVMADREQFTALSREFAELEPVIKCFAQNQVLSQQIEEAEVLLDDDDPEMRELASEDLAQLKQSLEQAAAELQALLLPRDPNDAANVF